MNLTPEDKVLITMWVFIIPIMIILAIIGFMEDSNKPNKVVIKCPQNTEKSYLFCK